MHPRITKMNSHDMCFLEWSRIKLVLVSFLEAYITYNLVDGVLNLLLGDKYY